MVEQALEIFHDWLNLHLCLFESESQTCPINLLGQVHIVGRNNI